MKYLLIDYQTKRVVVHRKKSERELASVALIDQTFPDSCDVSKRTRDARAWDRRLHRNILQRDDIVYFTRRNPIAWIEAREIVLIPDWVRLSWDTEEPACVRCGVSLFLNEGAEWSDNPALNVCHNCALAVLETLVERG